MILVAPLGEGKEKAWTQLDRRAGVQGHARELTCGGHSMVHFGGDGGRMELGP